MSFKFDLLFEGAAYVTGLMFWYLGEGLIFAVTLGRRNSNWMAPFEDEFEDGPYSEIPTWVGIAFCAAVAALVTQLL